MSLFLVTERDIRLRYLSLFLNRDKGTEWITVYLEGSVLEKFFINKFLEIIIWQVVEHFL